MAAPKDKLPRLLNYRAGEKRGPRGRKVMAAVAVVAGGALLAFEVSRFGVGGSGERWFWLAVGVLVVVLGAVELLSKAPPRP